VDFNVNGTCDAIMERFTNAFSFANLGLALQCWNVKPLVGNILYVGSDGLSVLFQWVPDQKSKLFATISGTQRLQQVVDIVKAEMEKLNAERKVETPPIKRGLDLNPYVQMAAGQIVEYDFQKVLFHEKTEYQDIKIMQTGQFGNMLLLDDDPNLADSDKPYTEAIIGHDFMEYEGKSVLILGGGDGGILNMLRTRHNPKYIEMVEIDSVVMRECAKHMRATAGDSMDNYTGENYQIFCEDCIPRLKQYAEEGKTFDVVINDLTAIPCTLDDELADDLWNFLKLILDLSMAVLSPTGHYFTQGNAKNCIEPLKQYEKILDGLETKVYYSSKEVTVPSYQEQWMFYHIRKQAEPEAAKYETDSKPSLDNSFSSNKSTEL